MEATAARHELGGRAQSRPVRPAPHAAGGCRHELSLQWHERGLPLPQCVDSRHVGPGAAAGAGLFLRWWQRGRRWLRAARSEEHTSELQSRQYLVCRLLLEKKKKISMRNNS